LARTSAELSDLSIDSRPPCLIVRWVRQVGRSLFLTIGNRPP
jgi:hypothetical protein